MFSSILFPALLTLGVVLILVSVFGRKNEKSKKVRMSRIAGQPAKPMTMGEDGEYVQESSGYEEYDQYEERSGLSYTFEKILAMVGVDYRSFEKEIRTAEPAQPRHSHATSKAMHKEKLAMRGNLTILNKTCTIRKKVPYHIWCAALSQQTICGK
jgi:hypothetical protein